MNLIRYWRAMFYEDNLVFVTSEGDLFYFQTDGKLKSLGSLPRKNKKMGDDRTFSDWSETVYLDLRRYAVSGYEDF